MWRFSGHTGYKQSVLLNAFTYNHSELSVHCCIFQSANRCFANCLPVEIIFFSISPRVHQHLCIYQHLGVALKCWQTTFYVFKKVRKEVQVRLFITINFERSFSGMKVHERSRMNVHYRSCVNVHYRSESFIIVQDRSFLFIYLFL